MKVIRTDVTPGSADFSKPDAGPGRTGESGEVFLHLARRTAGVASLNLSPRPGDVEGNLEQAEEALTRLRGEHPSLRWVVLPELFTSGYTGLTSVHRYAEDAEEGPGARRFCELARQLDLYIAYGFAERLPGTSGPSGVADSANLVGPEGVILTYRKHHLVRETGEDRVFVPGVELPTVEAGGVRVALAICWDLGFPEVVRGAALEGAELILAPAGWREPYGTQYDLSCAARALDNGIFLASANQLGDYPEAHFGTPGHVYGPNGDRISELTGPAAVGELDLEVIGEWRNFYGSTLSQGEVSGLGMQERRAPGGSRLQGPPEYMSLAT